MIGCLTETTTYVVAKPLVCMKLLSIIQDGIILKIDTFDILLCTQKKITILSLKAIKCLSVCVCVCVSAFWAD